MPDEDKYQFGLTKIFFRAGIVAYMEKLRADRIKEAVTLLQKKARRYVSRAQHVVYMESIRTINRYVRGMLARREAQVRFKGRHFPPSMFYCPVFVKSWRSPLQHTWRPQTVAS